MLWLRDLVSQWRTTDALRRVRTFFAKLGCYAWKCILIFAIGYVVIVYPVYFLFTSHYPMQKQTSDTVAILTSFGGGSTPAGQSCHGTRCLADLDIAMTKNQVLRPYAQYMLGVLMVLQRVDGGNTIYFWGQVVGSGGVSYFPKLFALKETIPTLIIVFLALLLALWGTIKKAIAAPKKIMKNIYLIYLDMKVAEL